MTDWYRRWRDRRQARRELLIIGALWNQPDQTVLQLKRATGIGGTVYVVLYEMLRASRVTCTFRPIIPGGPDRYLYRLCRAADEPPPAGLPPRDWVGDLQQEWLYDGGRPTLADLALWADQQSVGPKVMMARQAANLAEVALMRYLAVDPHADYRVHGARYALSQAIEACDRKQRPWPMDRAADVTYTAGEEPDGK